MKTETLLRPNKNRCAIFTMIELLIVISILAILIGILLPALKKAQGKAHTISCASNQRQLYLGAFAMYISDCNSWIMPDNICRADLPWRVLTKDYLKLKTNNRKGPLFCPSDTLTRSNYNPSSYGMNIISNTTSTNGAPLSPFLPKYKIERVKMPSGSAYLMDIATHIHMVPGTAEFWIQNAWRPDHLDGMNFLFLDGHTKYWTTSGLIAQGSASYTPGHYFWNWKEHWEVGDP